MIIDFHVHTFPKEIAPMVTRSIGLKKAGILPFTDATPEALMESMKKSGISYSVNLPVPTNMKQTIKLNRLAIESKEEHFRKGIINFGGMHPMYEDYRTILKDLADHGIPGIKIHPAFMNIEIDDIRCLRVISYASELGLAVLVHAGVELTTCDHNFCPVKGILRLVEEVTPEKLILAHMGNMVFWKDVEEYLCGAPVWFDSSYSLGKVYRHPQATVAPFIDHKLNGEDFMRIARKHGTDRILFGSDSPWGDQQIEVNMIRELDFTREELEMIFSGNAQKILNLS